MESGVIIMGNNKNNSFKYGSLSVISVVIVIVIAVLVNLMMIKMDIKFDITPNKIYSLGDKTKDIIKNLKKDVTVYGLFDDGKVPNDPGDTSEYQIYSKALDILEEYKKLSKKVSVKYIDPDTEPAIMTELDPQGTKGLQKGDFVFKCGKNVVKISLYDIIASYQSQMDEQLMTNFLTAEFTFTSTIKRVTADKAPTIYFTEGHQEPKYDADFKYVKQTLESASFETKSINLITTEKVPEDAEALMILSPRKDLTSDEQQKIYDYLNKGGKAMFMLDPITPNTDLPQFEKILNDYGMSLDYDRVKETEGRHVPNKPNDIVVFPEVNEINARINEMGIQLYMPNARSINILKTSKDGLTITPLIKSSEKAMGEQIDKSKGDDITGPLVLAAAAEYSSIGSRVAVIGNAAFFSDQIVNQDYNSMYFFLTVSSWILEKKDDLQIPPKVMDSPGLELNQNKANITGLILIVVIPLLIFTAGTVVWVRRRHL
jgi:ABC-type uncharacterized transport system involved in gliding motility auxiliary subunit